MSKVCPECESSNHLSWVCTTATNSPVADGRLRMHEINVQCYLSCEYCSETVDIISGDEAAHRLNKLDGFNTLKGDE